MSNGEKQVTPPRRVDLREFHSNLTGFLRQARQGTSFLVTIRDEVLAEIRPPSVAATLRRKPGALRGQIRMADDSDALPSDILAAMEARER